LFVIFRRRHGRLASPGLAASMLKMGFCAAVMALACYASLKFSGFAAAQRLLQQVGLLMAMIAGAMAIYLGLAWALGCEELAELRLVLRRTEPGAVPLADAGG